jgi:hypothetical protein
MPPRSKRTKAREERFLAALRRGLSVGGAAAEAGISYGFAYKWRTADPGFAARWQEAYEEGTDSLEDEARRRAVEGTATPVHYGGKEIGKIHKYSDSMLMFLLRGRRPEKYGPRLTPDHANSGLGPTGISHDGLSDPELVQRIIGVALRIAEGDAGARDAGGDRPLAALAGPRQPEDADAPGPGPRKPGG